MMEKKPMALKLLMTLAFSTLGERAFMNRTVADIMWGYEDPLVNVINKYFPSMFPVKGKFGLFAGVSVAHAKFTACVLFSMDTTWTPVASLLWSWPGALGAGGVKGRKPNSYRLMKIENLLPHLTANSKDGLGYSLIQVQMT